VSCPINSLAFVAIKVGRRQGGPSRTGSEDGAYLDFVLGADYIEFVRPYGTRRFAASELAGYNTLIVMFHLVPMFFIRLYRRREMSSDLLSLDASVPLKEVIRIPVSFADRAEVEGWCARRLAVVDSPGSPLRPKPRFRNTGKS
jgi:hypothetical protein